MLLLLPCWRASRWPDLEAEGGGSGPSWKRVAQIERRREEFLWWRLFRPLVGTDVGASSSPVDHGCTASSGSSIAGGGAAGGEAAWSRQGGGSPTMAEAPPRAGAAAAGAAQGSNGSVGSPVAGLVSGAVDFLLCFPHPKRIEVVLLRCAAAPAPSFAAPPSPSPRRRIGGERRGAARGEGPIAGASSRSYSCSGS
ncbi:unnamed protein product [Urochloa humidicola]